MPLDPIFPALLPPMLSKLLATDPNGIGEKPLVAGS